MLQKYVPSVFICTSSCNSIFAIIPGTGIDYYSLRVYVQEFTAIEVSKRAAAAAAAAAACTNTPFLGPKRVLYAGLTGASDHSFSSPNSIVAQTNPWAKHGSRQANSQLTSVHFTSSAYSVCSLHGVPGSSGSPFRTILSTISQFRTFFNG